jgi:hypothetical protein
MDMDDLIKHNDPYINQVVEIIQSAKKEYEDGNLTKEQLKEISDDVLQLDQIEHITTDLNRKILIEDALNILDEIIQRIL